MDSNAGTNELFEHNEMMLPIAMGREDLKILVSPASESSGVSSLDAEEAKKIGCENSDSSNCFTSTSETCVDAGTGDKSSDENNDLENGIDKLTEQKTSDNEIIAADETEQPSIDNGKEDETDAESIASQSKEQQDDNISECDALALEQSITDDTNEPELLASPLPSNIAVVVANDVDNNADNNIDYDELARKLDDIRMKNLKIVYNGRDILDFESNVANKSWYTQAAHLPEHNIHMFMANRSQYHRLASAWTETIDYPTEKCGHCNFVFPVSEPTENQPANDGPSICQFTNLLSSLNANKPMPTKPPTQQLNLSPGAVGNAINYNAPPMNRISPISNTLKALSQKLSQAANPIANQSNNFTNFVNNMAMSQQQNGMNQNMNGNVNQFTQWRQQTQQNQQNQQNALSNALNGNLAALNVLANYLPNNNGSQFNPNMNILNGMGGGNAANNLNDMNVNSNHFNRLMVGPSNQMPNRQIHGMCRQNSNKSGNNFIGNMNQNKLPQSKMYSHF